MRLLDSKPILVLSDVYGPINDFVISFLKAFLHGFNCKSRESSMTYNRVLFI